MMMNSYERGLVNRLQVQMSKREAQEALYDIRENLYGDTYHSISPVIIVERNGKHRKDYPSYKSIIWAYFNDDYSRFKVEDSTTESKEEKLSVWDVLPESYRKKGSESKKAYMNRIYTIAKPLEILDPESRDWQRFSLLDEDINTELLRKLAKKLNLIIEHDELFSYENGYSDSIGIHCTGLECIALFKLYKKSSK